MSASCARRLAAAYSGARATPLTKVQGSPDGVHVTSTPGRVRGDDGLDV